MPRFTSQATPGETRSLTRSSSFLGVRSPGWTCSAAICGKQKVQARSRGGAPAKRIETLLLRSADCRSRARTLSIHRRPPRRSTLHRTAGTAYRLAMSEGRTIAGTIRQLAESGAKKSRIFGLRGGAAAYFVGRFLGERPWPALVVAATVADAESWVRALRFFLGESERLP